MKPDFIISQQPTEAGMIFIVLPTHAGALTWLFAHVEATERRSMSAHLSDARLAQFKSDAAVQQFTFTDSFSLGLAPGSSSPQPAGGGRN
jgi:hypothetical protein